MRSGKHPSAFPLLALTACLAMPAFAGDGEFAVGQDFLSAEPARNRGLPGSELQNIKHLAPRTLDQLIAASRGQLPLDRKAAVLPMVLNPNKPLVFVSGPQTQGQLTAVVLPDDMKAREKEEEEILREAEAALKMDLPTEPEPRPLPMAKAKQPVITPKVLAQTLPQTAVGARLELTDLGGELKISPKTLRMSVQDDGITVVDKNLRGAAPQIFLRNAKVVRWDAARKKLDGRDIGRTELYITYRDQLYIVPIEVSGGVHRDPLLAEGPASFQKLTSVMPLLEQPYASYGDLPSAPAQAPAPASPETASEKPRQPLTLATSVAQVEATRERIAEQQTRFFYPDANPDYRNLDIQVLDERSSPESAEIFPVSGVSVRILGTRLKAQTTIDGHAKFGELPEGARFFVEVQDEKNGQIVPTVSEIALYRGGKDQVMRARTMNYRSYSHYLNILDIAQDAEKASLCARVMSEDGRQPLPGYKASINVEADGPYYVSQLGWPQPGQHQTDAAGRFCFFNVKPGLVELNFHQGGRFQTALSLPVFAGAHTDEDLPLARDEGGRVFLAAMPSAVDQIYEEKAASDQPLQPIDFVDMVTVGDNENMTRVGDSVLGYEGGMTLFKGRLYTVAQAPEFETALYAFDRDKQIRKSMPVVPLLQRGYIQDVFHELAIQDNHASIAFDPALGSVIVLHRMESDIGAVNVSLVDSMGHVFNEGWSFGNPEQGLSRTVFFNMNPGLYSVVVESQQGAILSLDTIAVDFWTASVAQTGSSAHYNLQRARRED